MKLPDRFHLTIGKATSTLPRTVGLSAFGYHVFGVVVVSADGQVKRVDAGRIIATVENDQAVRNRTDEQFVSETMGPDALSLIANDAGEFSVSSLRLPAFPFDATGVSFTSYSIPELFIHRMCLPFFLTGLGAKSTPSLDDFFLQGFELDFADFASFGNNRPRIGFRHDRPPVRLLCSERAVGLAA